MKDELIIKKFIKQPWEVWLHRRFHPFVTYLMMKAGKPSIFNKVIGTSTGCFPYALYDTDDWYSNEPMFKMAGLNAEKFLKEKNIFEITKQCEDKLEKGRVIISELGKSTNSILEVFKEFLDFFEGANVYIWAAHASEQYYYKKIRDAVHKFFPDEDAELIIGDISFPSKKNALALMDTDIRNGISIEVLHKKYAWLKSRGGFREGYTIEEMLEIQKTILESNCEMKHKAVAVPDAMKSLVQEVRELVYLRTLRTDALYEMYYLAQPIFKRLEKELSIDCVGNYIPDHILQGRIERIPKEHAILLDGEEVVIVNHSIIKNTQLAGELVSGVVAQRGKAQGIAKIVNSVVDLEKVEVGDILITNMTIPAYIIAMHKAAAFVTNEGGITCHAAIIAREIKKPCVIGTKIATQIFKDGDVVEVDANKGIVRKV